MGWILLLSVIVSNGFGVSAEAEVVFLGPGAKSLESLLIIFLFGFGLGCVFVFVVVIRFDLRKYYF